MLGGNDNWKDNGQQFKIAATGYAPAFDNESAWIVTLEPGVYTMNTDSEQGAGIALVETYGFEIGSIADVLTRAASGELYQESSILLAALGELPELAAALAGPGPCTFLAPTDEAFLAMYDDAGLAALVADTAA